MCFIDLQKVFDGVPSRVLVVVIVFLWEIEVKVEMHHNICSHFLQLW